MSTAKVSASVSYTGNGGATVTPVSQVAAPFDEFAAGSLAVADGTTSGTPLPVDFGTVSRPTVVLLKNTNNQEMQLSMGTFNLMPGGFVLVVQPAQPSDEMTPPSFSPTVTQDGDGTVETTVLGDPD